MMISEAMDRGLNAQITAELSAAHAYLAMTCALDDMGLHILAKRFLAQHDEEREHASKLIGYLQQTGGAVRLESIPQPAGDFADAEGVIRAALDSEKHVTQLIHKLVALADKEKDYATRSFLNWFVDEQVEEVASMTDLLALVKLAKGNMIQVESRLRHEMTAK